jgi:hypothetical protein
MMAAGRLRATSLSGLCVLAAMAFTGTAWAHLQRGLRRVAGAAISSVRDHRLTSKASMSIYPACDHPWESPSGYKSPERPGC